MKGQTGPLRSALIPAAALLPLRFFLGAMFVYAGLDKLLDPAFFDPNEPSSIQNQFALFERFSPLAPLVHLVEPYAVVLGLLIALGEIAVGLGAITGLAYRLSAIGGAVLALMFFLTASWTVRPYYLGPDLPYAFGWLTLALAGHGDLLVPSLARARPRQAAVATPTAGEVSRRQILQVGVLAGLTLLVGALTGGLRLLLLGAPGTAVGEPSSNPSSRPATTPGASEVPASETPPSPSPSPVNGIAVAQIADVERTGSARFRVPITAPQPLPAGDPGLVIRLADGSFVAYDATCTHEGCRVGWDAFDGIIVCPCHGAEFDAADHGAVIAGPTRTPLVELPIVIDRASGTILLVA